MILCRGKFKELKMKVQRAKWKGGRVKGENCIKDGYEALHRGGGGWGRLSKYSIYMPRFIPLDLIVSSM